jgi:hypothetical protein
MEVKIMNLPNIKIDDETKEKKDFIYYVSRINERISWPTNARLAEFVSNGKYKKYKILSIGKNNVKVVVIRK